MFVDVMEETAFDVAPRTHAIIQACASLLGKSLQWWCRSGKHEQCWEVETLGGEQIADSGWRPGEERQEIRNHGLQPWDLLGASLLQLAREPTLLYRVPNANKANSWVSGHLLQWKSPAILRMRCILPQRLQPTKPPLPSSSSYTVLVTHAVSQDLALSFGHAHRLLSEPQAWRKVGAQWMSGFTSLPLPCDEL